MKKIASAFLLSAAFLLGAAEYFVSPAGSDKNKGTFARPFKTVQHGVNKLKAGDTLTILPGLYKEAVLWRIDGDLVKKTTVRAQIPGSVLLHGDRSVSGFKAVPGRDNCYVLPCDKIPQGVNECDTLVMYKRDDTFLNTPFSSYGVWSYDAKSKQLYIATSDGKAPELHALTVSEIPDFGFRVISKTSAARVRNVVIDGLSVRGYSTIAPAAHSSLWGIAIWNAEKCLIRNCSTYLNEGGITMYFADQSRVEHCHAYGNGTTKHVSAGNIVIFNSKNSIIDNCFSFKSNTYGLRFYGTNSRNTIANSVSIADSRGSIWIKPDDRSNKLFRCYTPGMVACNQSAQCVYGANDYDRSGKGGPTSLVMGKKHVFSCGNDFADPWNFDFRLQKNSSFKKGFAGENVFFLSPAGKDTADGRSVKTPWKSLKNVPANSTVYLLPGTYPGELTLNAPHVTIAGRGYHAPALIKGGKWGICVKGDNAVIRNLEFSSQKESAVLIESKSVTIEKSRFASLPAAVISTAAPRVIITHCAFAPTVREIFKGRGTGYFTHNITPLSPAGLEAYANVPAPTPAPSLDGRPYGPYNFLYLPADVKPDHVKVFANSSTSANVAWSMNNTISGGVVSVVPAKGGKAISFTDFSRDSHLHSVTLTNLKPATEYIFNILLRPSMTYVLSSGRIKSKFDPAKLKHTVAKSARFTTLAADRKPVVWHVSPQGSDENDGSSQKPFRTISKGAMAAAPGDTVLVAGGTYEESVFLPVSGTAEKPITFKAAPHAEVWLDGVSRHFSRGFFMFGKHYLNFDGFRFKKFGTAYPNSSGIFFAAGSSNINISRCFNDGRGGGYAPALIHVRNSEKINLTQNVSIGGMTALTVVESYDVNITNNVFKKPAIWTLALFNADRPGLLFANNIVTDNVRAKTFQAPLKTACLKSLTEKNNLYFMRFPRNLRKIVEYTPQGKLKQCTLDEYYKLINQDGKSFFADPEIKVLSTQLCWRNAAERSADLKKPMSFQRDNNNLENARNPENFKQFRHWSFGDFFNAKLFREKGIGLDPECFKDMAVKAAPGYDNR